MHIKKRKRQKLFVTYFQGNRILAAYIKSKAKIIVHRGPNLCNFVFILDYVWTKEPIQKLFYRKVYDNFDSHKYTVI